MASHTITISLLVDEEGGYSVWDDMSNEIGGEVNSELNVRRVQLNVTIEVPESHEVDVEVPLDPLDTPKVKVVRG